MMKVHSKSLFRYIINNFYTSDGRRESGLVAVAFFLTINFESVINASVSVKTCVKYDKPIYDTCLDNCIQVG